MIVYIWTRFFQCLMRQVAGKADEYEQCWGRWKLVNCVGRHDETDGKVRKPGGDREGDILSSPKRIMPLSQRCPPGRHCQPPALSPPECAGGGMPSSAVVPIMMTWRPLWVLVSLGCWIFGCRAVLWQKQDAKVGWGGVGGPLHYHNQTRDV